ncbi:uncharacterized protein V6R79_003857 [Siganus canaliculatus]
MSEPRSESSFSTDSTIGGFKATSRHEAARHEFLKTFGRKEKKRKHVRREAANVDLNVRLIRRKRRFASKHQRPSMIQQTLKQRVTRRHAGAQERFRIRV